MKAVALWAAKNAFIAIMICLGIIAAGAYAATKLAIDAVPDVTNVQVQVVTRAAALSATEVESQITQPIERGVAGIPGLTLVRSTSKLGISIVTLIFEDDVDVYFARQLVNERLVQIREQIPPGLGKTELGPVTTALGEIYMFELRGDGRSPEELRTIVEWQIGPKLRQVPGVIEVVGFGGALKQYRVTLDPARLAAHGVSIEMVQTAIERDNRVGGGGYVESAGEQIVLRGDARFQGIEDIESTVVRTDEAGIPVRIGQLGEVDTGPALRQGAMTRDGRGEIVGGSVFMLKGKNSRDVVKNVKEAITELSPRLPAGVRIEPYYDRADYIDRVLKTVAKNLSEGAVIVVVCLLLTLGSLRAGLLVAGAIPFAMLVGFIGLNAVGYTGNVMSLGAIDFGIVVEGAVLTVEHAMTHAGSITDRNRRRRAITHAMADVAKPAVFSVVITILVFLPLITLEDVEGKMFRPVVVSLCFMLAGALFYALVLVPAVGPRFLKGTPGGREPWLIRKARRIYQPALDAALKRPWAAVASAMVLTAALLGAGSQMGAEFLPRIFEGAYALDTTRPPSTSVQQAVTLSGEAERTLKEAPEVETVVSRIGRPEGAVDSAGPESADVFVMLKPREQWRPGMTPDKLAEELAAKLDARVPATLSAFSQPIEMRVNDLIAGVKGDVAIKVYGDDLTTMSEVADQIRKTVAQIPGAADTKMEIATGLPSIRVVVNRDHVGRLGVAPGNILDALAMARAGMPVGVVREGERVFDLTLRIGGERVDDERDLARLPLATSHGTLVPLSMVADLKLENTIVMVGREQMRRRLIVQSNVRGRDMVGFVKEAQAKVAELNIPKSVEVVWGGQFQNFNRAKARLAMLVPVSIGVIALMLVFMFRNVRYMLITILNLPFAVAGGVFALVLRGLPFSIPAGVGFIALCGVAVMTGIVMTQSLMDTPRDEDVVSRVRKASLAAFRAPLSTALVAAIGFIPAAIATGTGAEVQRPLATVVIGGLLIGMVLSMLTLPAMLLIVARRELNEPQKNGDEAKEDDDWSPLEGSHHPAE
ncbi:Cobalt-zinc-cadmium resistance protein CzcA [Labilithrix luteola]|uniref:Cobalt-zinc-cadmium resistance protein CzcA n=1 Tax=Labilithrix luteola TaxID=1391654 RepID=A0A0K1PSW2_9BACT|nr:CusA/CzcA family heavy metal efflux RND transporter [Labilithrix luteola]AKU96461.1 Cobalt-zinc-cadmium resistance protein CzcA [Labilithrix luteola]